MSFQNFIVLLLDSIRMKVMSNLWLILQVTVTFIYFLWRYSIMTFTFYFFLCTVGITWHDKLTYLFLSFDQIMSWRLKKNRLQLTFDIISEKVSMIQIPHKNNISRFQDIFLNHLCIFFLNVKLLLDCLTMNL